MCWEGGEANWVVGGGGGGKESLYANPIPAVHTPAKIGTNLAPIV